ncbi:SRPBCC family protein [Flagellimonas myxillae]|uniref:SRPBCC family protein n=1 Tax=Flagellimonas myxillae TaxID=2942214 RepID=UPI00201F734A|nr:SRPBCC domain-containing protein [Muricauda myxillae]MCL6267912.1 SRPBCC domain-containing protein [Muricauda myxillae]
MSQLTFDSFTKKIFIKSTMEKLYWCWGTAAGITSWFLSNALYISANGDQRTGDENIQAGDSYTWKWHNWDGEEKGTVLKANGKDFMEISFADSKVSVHLEHHKNAVLVSLKQYQIPTDETSKLNIHHGCSNGWTFWLANLKAYLEHGILLNETEFDLRNIPLSGYEFVNM